MTWYLESHVSVPSPPHFFPDHVSDSLRGERSSFWRCKMAAQAKRLFRKWVSIEEISGASAVTHGPNGSGRQSKALTPLVLNQEWCHSPLPPRGHWAMSRGMPGCHNGRRRCCWHLVSGGQVCWLTSHRARAGPLTRVTWPKMPMCSGEETLN